MIKKSSVNYDFSFHLVALIDITVLEGVSKSSRTESITKYTPAFPIGRCPCVNSKPLSVIVCPVFLIPEERSSETWSGGKRRKSGQHSVVYGGVGVRRRGL